MAVERRGGHLRLFLLILETRLCHSGWRRVPGTLLCEQIIGVHYPSRQGVQENCQF